jgi:hypothetical protein
MPRLIVPRNLEDGSARTGHCCELSTQLNAPGFTWAPPTDPTPPPKCAGTGTSGEAIIGAVIGASVELAVELSVEMSVETGRPASSPTCRRRLRGPGHDRRQVLRAGGGARRRLHLLLRRAGRFHI